MEPNETLLRAVEGARASGRPCALATIVRAKGSTPRSVGASMLIPISGDPIGTIGGGCGEADVLLAAADVIRTGVATLVRVELLDEVTSLSPAVCGGVMDVLVEPVLGAEEAAQANPPTGDGIGARSAGPRGDAPT